MYGKYTLFYESPTNWGYYAHVQTVCTRPLLGGEEPGDEAISIHTRALFPGLPNVFQRKMHGYIHVVFLNQNLGGTQVGGHCSPPYRVHVYQLTCLIYHQLLWRHITSICDVVKWNIPCVATEKENEKEKKHSSTCGIGFN